jgi:hypothetical protein
MIQTGRYRIVLYSFSSDIVGLLVLLDGRHILVYLFLAENSFL